MVLHLKYNDLFEKWTYARREGRGRPLGSGCAGKRSRRGTGFFTSYHADKMNIHKRYRIILLIGLGVLAAACVPAATLMPTTPDEAMAPSEVAPMESTATATEPPPTPTSPPPSPTTSPTPTLVDPVCVPAQDAGALEATAFEAYSQAILSYLNAGATVAELDRALYAAGVAGQPVPVISADFDGDGKLDVAVSIFDPQSQTFPPAGRLLLYRCVDGEYALQYSESSAEFEGTPHLWYVQDLNADVLAEVVVSYPLCGAHTCFERVEILGWDGTEFVDRLSGISNDLPTPDVAIRDPDGDGIFELAVTGSGFGSVGAGPPRSVTRVWAWDRAAGQWAPAGDVLGPSQFRVHVLHDADAAARRGDYEEALLLYGRVITDGTLDEWVQPELEQANLGAYARFKSVVMYSLLGQPDFAETVFQEMQRAYPPDIPPHAFTEMAEWFLEAFQTGGEAAACEAARGYADANEEDILAPLYFGYGNPTYEPEDICP